MFKQISLLMLTLFWGEILTYKAAILDFYPLMSDTPKSTILLNLNEYRLFAAKASILGVDIIVFPEYGLTTLTNNTRKYATIIEPFSDVVNRFQHMAAEYKMYMVVNLLERYQSHCCDTPIFYNTNIVFDRKGNIIGLYRKINLYKEYSLTPGPYNQSVTFTTDFGATFAIFSSYDILFEHPSRSVLKLDVTDVVYPNAWFSTLPFYQALSIQFGYSVSTGVNLLASGYSEPLHNLEGSGIFLGGGSNLKSYVSDTPNHKLIVFEVPKQQKKNGDVCTFAGMKKTFSYSKIDQEFQPQRDFYSSVYNFQTIDSFENTSTTICYKDFCCDFDVTVQNDSSSDYFKAVAYDGSLFFDQQKSHVRFCTLLVCEDESEKSCGQRTQTATIFSKIVIKKRLEKGDNTFYMPLTLKYNLQPMTNITYCHGKNSTNGTALIELSTMQASDILVFGLLGLADSAPKFQCFREIYFVMFFSCLYAFLVK